MLKRLRLDPFLILLASTVALAAALPARGAAVPVVEVATTAAVLLLFFLYGARLAPRAIVTGFAHWRLQLSILLASFALFPALGVALEAVLGGRMPAPLVTGLVFTCLLPSTVQSSIAFTSIARGNVPAALCAASASNIAGVVLTPLLVGLVLHAKGGFSFKALNDIALQLVLPFALGQVARPRLTGLLQRHRTLISYVDRSSILLVVYGAFSAGVVAGIWHQMDAADLLVVIGLDVLLLVVVLVATTLASRFMGFSKADEIAVVFCGSKKSMVSGIPMANILFPASAVGLVVLPLMLFHQIQLFACAFLAQRYGARAERTEAVLERAVS